MSSSDENETDVQPSTEVELAAKVDWLRGELQRVQATAERAVSTRKVGPLDEWVNVLADYDRLAQTICRTEFVPKDFRGQPEKTTAAMMFGREIGLPPMTTLQNTVVIYGRVSMYAEQLRAMILAAGHEYVIDESNSDRCTISARRKDSSRWQTHTYTMDQAKLAGLYVQNEQYRKRPTEMMLARASGIMAHAQFPDVIRGMGALEELEAEGAAAAEAPAVSGEPPRKATATVGRKRTAKAIAASDPVTKPDTLTAEQASETIGAVHIPESAGLPPLPGEAEAPASVTDEPKRMDVDEALSSAGNVPPVEMLDDHGQEVMSDDVPPPADDQAAAGWVDAESAPVADRPKPMHTAQTKALQARFKGLGFTDEPQDREQRLLVAEAIVGHPVDSFRAGDGPEHLTYDEAQAIMTALAPIRTRGDLIEFLSKLAQDAAAEESMTGPDGVEP